MKAKDIVLGGKYVAKVSGKLTTVRVDAIREVSHYAGTSYGSASKYREQTVYDVTNLTTGRKTVFRSAAKFQRVVGDPKARAAHQLKKDSDES